MRRHPPSDSVEHANETGRLELLDEHHIGTVENGEMHGLLALQSQTFERAAGDLVQTKPDTTS